MFSSKAALTTAAEMLALTWNAIKKYSDAVNTKVNSLQVKYVSSGQIEFDMEYRIKENLPWTVK